jgi:hypothetical protein
MIEQIYAEVESFYFSSGDFNGLPVRLLVGNYETSPEGFRVVLRSAIDAEILTARFDRNPHILAFSETPKAHVLSRFDATQDLSGACLYSHASRLRVSRRLSAFNGVPYSLELARGHGQLDFRTFDLSVLEFYRNDPRYSYSTDSIHGQICIENEFYESASMPEHDQVLLDTFGFAYDDQLNRYVAVFLRHLSGLSPEHQRIWAAKEVKGNIKLHPDYYASAIEGSWGTRIPIFEAFTQELRQINQMCKLMGKKELFRNSFAGDLPREFGFLLRPTVSEFNNFVLLLDKMMSDNMNKEFFRGDVELETEEVREDGKTVVRERGTIQLLEAWVNKYFRPKDMSPVESMFSSFRHVRKLRQKPAHAVNENAFDQKYFREQRETMIRAYDAIRTLRQVLSNHPAVLKNLPEISDQLFNGEIWDR